MIFIRAIGLADAEILDDEALRKLYAEIRSFVRSGGVVSATEWASLHFVEKEALEVAHTEFTKQNAADVGLAAQGYVAAAHVLAAIDGGAALDLARAGERREKLLVAARRAKERLESRKVLA